MQVLQMRNDFSFFGPEAVRNAKPVIPLFHVANADEVSQPLPANEELTKYGRRPHITHLSESKYRRRQTMTILILMSQAVLGSFTVVFALMMLLRAENS